MIRIVGGMVPPFDDDEFCIEAATFGEVIDAYQREFKCKLIPLAPKNEESKWFYLITDGLDEPNEEVDIHLIRNEEEVCLKQDLTYELQAGDTVKFISTMEGVAVC